MPSRLLWSKVDWKADEKGRKGGEIKEGGRVGIVVRRGVSSFGFVRLSGVSSVSTGLELVTEVGEVVLT